MLDKFHPERFGVVTASRCSPLVPKKDAQVGIITLAKELAKEKYFNFYDEVSTWQLEHGTLGENYAFEHYKKNHEPGIEKGRWIKSGETGCTTDAELPGQYGIDFKCPTSMDSWLEYIYSPIKKEYYDQCQLSMRLTGYKKWYIGAYLIETIRMSDNGDTYPVDEKSRMIIVEVLPDPEWNEKFDQNLPIVIKKREEFLNILKKHFLI